MKHLARRSPSPSMVVALIALFVSLGGVSYGVATGFIDSREIKDSTIRSRDVRNQALLGRDMRRDTLTNREIDNRTLNAATANRATAATTAATATEAGNAGTLGGLGPSAFVRVTPRVFDTGLVADVIDYGNNAPLATLPNLPAGTYIVVARVSAENDDAGNTDGNQCHLNVPGGGDTMVKVLDLGGTVSDQRVYPLLATFTSTTTSSVSLSCEQNGGDNDARDMRIIAVLQN